jgi:LacI family transcriptional regulator
LRDRSSSVAVLYSNPSAGYLNELLVGVLNRASLGHLQLIVEKCEAGGPEVGVPAAIANGVDGIIRRRRCAIRPGSSTSSRRSTRRRSRSRAASPTSVSAIGIDDYRAAYEMTRHLLALGHSASASSSAIGQTASARRLAGYRDEGSAHRGARGAGRPGRVQLPPGLTRRRCC